MCYDISFTVDIRQISEYFPELVWDEQIKIDFEKAAHIMGHAYGEQPVIFMDREDGLQHLTMMEWGCIPFYVKDEKAYAKTRALMLNARSEKILDDPKSYWNKIRNRRCLVPVTGFYEHRKVKSHTNKIPYLITLKEQPLFFLPALYSVAELPDKATGELVKRFTFTVVTRTANTVMAAIHNEGSNTGRMPLLLPLSGSKKWLDDSLGEDEYREILNYQMPNEALEFKTVWTIRSPKLRPDEKRKDEEFIWEGLEPLEIG